ncbi:MAG: hypothetical protein KC582_00015 [Candidatus Magasanikbacteria bacterium]|nr:hypothetical protein [Candidatus Magasanikbacteria bacterium]USN52384.1 MAG: hypothetical protein H6759_05230 [Candidatus Nomurabacteria bacterium]
MFHTRSLFALIVSFSFLLVMPTKSHALTVGPAITDISLDAGMVTTTNIVVGNNDAIYKTFDFSTETFEADGDKGQSRFLGKTGAANWFIMDASVTLQPGENRKVPISLRVPQDVTPGSYQVVVFITERGSTESGVTNLQRIGVLFFLMVQGDTNVVWSEPEFQQVFSQVVSFGNTFRVGLENKGNTYGVPSGTIEIASLFGTSKKISLNPQQVRVLPGSKRSYVVGFGDTRAPKTFVERIKQEWTHFAIGPYTAKMQLDGYPEVLETSFIVLPTALISIFTGILLLLLVVITWAKYVRRTV